MNRQTLTKAATTSTATTLSSSGTSKVVSSSILVAPSLKNDESIFDLEESCPVCKSDRYLNPSMRLLVSPCYHRVCSSCVERLYSHGASPCPVCGTILRQSNFVMPSFENLKVEKECRIRKKIVSVFNKREQDFETLRDYNDYLEEVEGIVFNLVEDVDVQKTNAMLEAYRQQNVDQIGKNKLLQEQEEAEQKRRQAEEVQHRMDYELQLLAELEAENEVRQKQEKRFIDELAKSTQSAATVVSNLRTVGKDLKRKAKEAALQEMPSLKGLRLYNNNNNNGGDFNKPPPPLTFDPFDTVPKVECPIEIPKNVSFEAWFFGSRTPDLQQLTAGGVIANHLAFQVLVAAFNF